MTLTTKERAKEAIAEYNAVHETGGELPYPHWADAVLAEIEQAEQLTQQVEALGGVE